MLLQAQEDGKYAQGSHESKAWEGAGDTMAPVEEKGLSLVQADWSLLCSQR